MDTYYRAKELYAEGNLPESHKLLTNFIVSQRGISGNAAAQLTDAFNTRGHIHYRWVDFDEAIQDYSEAIKVDPKFAVAYYNRGQVHYRLGKKFGELYTDVCPCVVASHWRGLLLPRVGRKGQRPLEYCCVLHGDNFKKQLSSAGQSS